MLVADFIFYHNICGFIVGKDNFKVFTGFWLGNRWGELDSAGSG
jgi:hypothetical protein